MQTFNVTYINNKGKKASTTVQATTTDDAIDNALLALGSTCRNLTSCKPKAEPKVKLPHTNRSIEDLLG